MELHTHIGNKRKPMSMSLMVIMASGIARGRVRTTTTVESRMMAAILQIIIQPRFIVYFFDV